MMYAFNLNGCSEALRIVVESEIECHMLPGAQTLTQNRV